MTFVFKRYAFLTLVLGLAGSEVPAQTSTTTFQVTATISASCSVTASNLGFGSYNPLSGSLLTGTSTVTANCTSSTPYTIGLDAGSAPGATVTTRRMQSGGNELNYSLFRDAARSLNWGNTPGVDTVAGTGTGGAQAITVYGAVPASQTSLPPASYSDTVTATINF